MLARIAHELFWLGRSVARANHTARLLESVFHAQLEGQRADPSAMTLSWDSLLAMTGASPPEDEPGPARQDETIALLVADRTQPASIVASINAAHERARAVRDVISLDMWETINTFHMRVCQRDITPELRREPSAVFDLVRERCSLFWGVQRRTMLHDDGWAFLNAGAELEAADIVVRMLRVTLPSAYGADENDSARDGPALALLRAVGGLQAFRRAAAMSPHLVPVARFLLFESAFPDSIAACVEGLRSALASADVAAFEARPVLRLSRLAADLDFRRREASGVPGLLATLEIAQRELAAVDGDISQRYFAGAERPALHVSFA
jgi:uncharacterized alpha-E superfamily protein